MYQNTINGIQFTVKPCGHGYELVSPFFLTKGIHPTMKHAIESAKMKIKALKRHTFKPSSKVWGADNQPIYRLSK